MKISSVEDAAKKIGIYLKQNTLRPYFVIADDIREHAGLKKIFNGFKCIYISDFCAGDCFLDVDLLIEKLNAIKDKALCFGLGEYIYFSGQEQILRTLQDKTFNGKIIFVCRGIANELKQLAVVDYKFRTNNICRLDGRTDFFVVKYSPSIKIETDAPNFSELLKLTEGGAQALTVQSDLPLENVKSINTYYDAIKNRNPHFNVSSEALTEAQWKDYFLNDECEGYPTEHWRSFAAGFKNKISNRYLQYVFERSTDFEAYRKNLFFALIDAEGDKYFDQLYELRKAALKNISSEYLFQYVERLEELFDGSDRIKFLTDNSAVERRSMIKAIQGKEKIPDVLNKNYAAMRDYLTDYDCGDDEITNYFRRYKKIKLLNVDDEQFKRQVQALSTKRPYNKFATRQTVLDRADRNAELYWLDALGVEFLSYIKARSTECGLSVDIKIVRAELPTLTAQNKSFYDDWSGDKFEKNQRLDELKHTPETFDADGKCSAPTYIEDEFSIIDGAIDEIKNALKVRQAKKIILTSDHGASRLAVMYGRENKYKMHSNGEHSGRCCPINDLDEKPNCATEENGYWVLANYERFAGGRLSSIEVHGGATLEEILVPVIEFSLQGSTVETKTEEKTLAPLKDEDDGFDFFD